LGYNSIGFINVRKHQGQVILDRIQERVKNEDLTTLFFLARIIKKEIGK